MKLFLNTSIAKRATASIIDGKGKIVSQVTTDSPLLAIEKVLKKANLKLTDINNFEAHPGPGSYTGLRVGAAIINALNFALGKKVRNVEIKYE